MDLLDLIAQGIQVPDKLPTTALNESTVNSIINFILQIAGALSLVFIMISAVKFSTSGGDPQAISSARRTIIYSLVGLTISVSAFTILSIVGQEARDVASEANPFFGPDGIVTTVVSWLGYVVGAASVIGIIYGAIRYITSAGQSQSAQAARSTIIYSLVGIAVAMSAQAIVIFVLEKL